MMRRYVTLGILLATLGVFLGLLHGTTNAASDFSLQITPSPLVATAKPGKVTDIELKIRNAGSKAENLKIEPRSFTIDNEQLKLNDTAPPEVANWITFSQQKFTTQPGEWTTQHIRLAVPKDAGFSYSFALVISRQSDPKPTKGGRLVKGSVADFALINVDRPGATRKLDVVQITASKRLYEYLPASLSVRIKNTGNTIVQPYGNIFIQRGDKSSSPLATLPVNESKGYILPGTERTLTSSWNDGFPVYTSATAANGTVKQSLKWDWSKSSKFKIGPYTAKLVAVYNDGQHDVPIQGEVRFWVLPWKSFLLLLVVITGLWFVARWRAKRRTEKAVKKALANAKKAEASKHD